MEISLEIVVADKCSTKPPELLSFQAFRLPSLQAFQRIYPLHFFCLIKNGCMIFLFGKRSDRLASLRVTIRMTTGASYIT